MSSRPADSSTDTTDLSTTACYLCGGTALTRIRNRVRHDIPRSVLTCDACGFNFLEPVGGDLSVYYQGDYRSRHSAVLGRRLSSGERFDLQLPFQEARVDRVRHLLRTDTAVLDVGCSSGFFLHSIRPHVARCVGIELDREDTAFVREELGLEVYSSPVEQTDLSEGSFDLITAFHVLEHLADPRQVLKTLRRYLKPGGHVYFEVPNADDALLSVLGVEAYADFWYREPHLFNFNPSTFTELMRQADLTGRTFTIQRYSLLNHLHWKLLQEPQSSFRKGTDATLVENRNADPDVRQALNDFMARVDREYKELLNAHGRGDCVVFIGRRTEDA